MSVQDNQVQTFDSGRDLLTVLQNLLALLGTTDYSAVNLGNFGGRTLTDTTNLLNLLGQFESQYDLNFSGVLGSIPASTAVSVSDANTGLVAVSPGDSSSTLNILGFQPKLVINTHPRNLLLLQSGGAALAPGEVGAVLNTGVQDAYSIFALGNIYGDTLPQVSQHSGDYSWNGNADRNLFWGLTSTADGTISLESAALWQPGVMMRVTNVSATYYARLEASGADLIDGDTTAISVPPRGSVVLSSNGANSWLSHNKLSPEFSREVANGNHTMTTFERVIHWGSGSTGAGTITLPAVASAFADGVRYTDRFTIENHSTTHDLVVDPNGAELLHLNATETLSPGQSLEFHLRQDNTAWYVSTASAGTTSGAAGVLRSVVNVTGQIASGTAVSVNGAQANTTHSGSSLHSLGANSGVFNSNLHLSVRILINGVPETVVFQSPTSFSFADDLYVGTTILVETDL